ncbi:glycoside hydrolase family 5 protein [Cerasicoccus fimbriatus]|uniref:glycoside hydrolase family 5 protein n=1 Tax=Cerasicoccus fimbriatus TaxID=3014554 RepID=UPI0022B41D0D|nr:glycoside hydrolase family 5 protein [Cerasicoccus sp. TK19100]
MFKRLSALGALVLLPLSGTAEQTQMFGVNLSGAEDTSAFPGSEGTNYIYPKESELDYFHSKGLRLIRLPFRWERVQPSLFGSLNSTELGYIDAFLDAAAARDMMVILDMHNYAGRWVPGEDSNPNKSGEQGFKLGTTELPVSAFGDVWEKLAAYYKDRDNIWAYGLMNEPNGVSTTVWLNACQDAVDGIRNEDMNNYVLLPGTYYSNAHRWDNHGEYLINVVDPADKRIFEAHSYWDNNSSGQYTQSYAGGGHSASDGVNDLTDFVDWCNANNVQGFIGEFGVPWNDSNWAPMLENALDYMAANGISATYWAGGPWWSNDYPLDLELDERNNAPRYPLAILQQYASGPIVNYAPDFTLYHDSITGGMTGVSYAYKYAGSGATVNVNEQSSDTDYTGSRSFKINYSIPSGSTGNAGMHIDDGIYLEDNFAAPDQVLSFYVKGDSGATLSLKVRNADGYHGATVNISNYGPALSSDWARYEIPLQDLIGGNMTGEGFMDRIQFEPGPHDGSSRNIYIDLVRVQGPTYIPGAMETTLLADDFNDGDADGWSFVGGSWSVVSNELKQNGNNPDTMAWFNTPEALGWHNYTINADLRSTDNDEIGFAFCVQDSMNYYLLTISKQFGLYYLDAVVDGSVNSLTTASGSYTTGSSFNLEVRVEDGVITVDRDGSTVFTYSDTTFTQGGVGMYAHNCDDAFFDNVVVNGYSGEAFDMRGLGDVNYGIACQDGATGTGYIMWSEENVYDRFDPDPYSDNSSNLIAVIWDGSQWRYDSNSAYVVFTPEDSDVLLAEVDFSNDTITSLEGTDDKFQGMTRGFESGNLTFRADRWHGTSNDGEFTVSGSFFRINGASTAGETVSLGDVNYGVAVQDSATGTGFIMWSQQNVYSRFNPDPYENNSSNLIAVVWNGSQWQYDDNFGLNVFTPQSTDVLIAEVDFTNDTITSLEGINDVYQGIDRGFASGDLTFSADVWKGGSNDGEFTIGGTSFTKN